MEFLTNYTGLPIPTSKPLRNGSYHVVVTKGGFVIGDPQAFAMPSLAREAAALPTGSGFTCGHLHLYSTRFPMYFPGASPRLLLVSRCLAVMPLRSVPQPLFDAISQQIDCPPDFGVPDAELLRNVLPSFEIFHDASLSATSSRPRLIHA